MANKILPIGSRFEFKGLWYEVVVDEKEYSSCSGCAFRGDVSKCTLGGHVRGECAKGWRTDGQSVIFKQVQEDKEMESKKMTKKYVEQTNKTLTFNTLFDTGALCASWKSRVLDLKSNWKKGWKETITGTELNDMIHSLRTDEERQEAIKWLIEQRFCTRVRKQASIEVDIRGAKDSSVGVYAVDADEEWKELLYKIDTKNGKLTICGMNARTRELLESSGIRTLHEDDIIDMAEEEFDSPFYPYFLLD